MANLSKILIFILFLSGCSLTSYYTDPVYEDYTDEVYFWEDSILGTPYFGYWHGYYYYYGIPHYWPWWYYYTYRPATHYHIHTHVHVHCPSGSFVYAYGNRKFNNKKLKCTKDSWSNELYRPQTSRWVLPDNKIQYNKNNRYNINKTDYDRNFNPYGKFNQNHIKHNNTINFNKNNKINKGNNGSTRPNKTRINQKKKR
jgi:hypothetical protein